MDEIMETMDADKEGELTKEEIIDKLQKDADEDGEKEVREMEETWKKVHCVFKDRSELMDLGPDQSIHIGACALQGRAGPDGIATEKFVCTPDV